MLGSLVLQSTGSAEVLPIFKDYETGSHTPGRNNGVWFYEKQYKEQEVYLPQRDKQVTVLSDIDTDWEQVLVNWEAADLKMTQADKLGVLQTKVKGTAMLNAKGQHGSWSIVHNSPAPLYLTGVRTSKSVQLLWSTQDVIPKLRNIHPEAYTFYRFPNIVSHVFLNTQAICSKWWRWSNSKNSDILKLFNALEVKLVKVY